MKKRATAVDMVITLDDMRADIASLVALLDTKRLHRFEGLVSGGQHLEAGRTVKHCRHTSADGFGATVRQFATDYPVLRVMCDPAARSPHCEFDRPGAASNYGPSTPRHAEALL